MRGRRDVNITKEMLKKYQDYPQGEEKSLVIIEEYIRDVRRFIEHLGSDREFSRERIRDYKQELKEAYKIISANSILATVNSFLVFVRHGEWKVRLFKIQKVQYSRSRRGIIKEKYKRLIHTACRQGDEQMSMPLQTTGNTGVRISKLKSITVGVLNDDRAEIYNRGKYQVVLLPEELTRLFRKCRKKARIVAESIFISRRGSPVDRSSVSKKIKQLGREAGMDMEKTFPHNL